MSDLLTNDELAAIAEREAKATKGPWVNCDGKRKPGKSIFLHATACEEEDIYGGPSRYGPHRDYVCNCLESSPINNEQALLNTDFIAHARTDIPALLRHIAALEARTPAQQFPDLSKLRDDAPEPEVFTVVDLPDQQQDLAPEIQQLISANMDALVDQPAPPDVERVLAEADMLGAWTLSDANLYPDKVLMLAQDLATHLRAALADLQREREARERAEVKANEEERQHCQTITSYTEVWKKAESERDEARAYAEALFNQVSTRQVTCVYCGHQYDDGTPQSQDERLTEHIKSCEKHPMRKLEAEKVLLEACVSKMAHEALAVLMSALNTYNEENPWFGVCSSVALLLSERDAALARAEKAEAEREQWKLDSRQRSAVCDERTAERDSLRTQLADARAELARLGPVEYEQASPNIDMWWPERVTDLECKTNRRRAIRRVLTPGENGGAA